MCSIIAGIHLRGIFGLAIKNSVAGARPTLYTRIGLRPMIIETCKLDQNNAESYIILSMSLFTYVHDDFSDKK